MTPPRKRTLVLVLAGAWLLAVTAGLRGLWAYANRPGEIAAAVADWPRDTALRRHPSRATLVMFVHPMCPCSRASAAELARAMGRCGEDKLCVQVVAVESED